MINNNRQHDYLICIDSDGTIMDTMTIKHVNCFGPCFLEVFGINEHKEDILNHWNTVNLYSLTRGINRFQGLKEILEYVSSTYNINFDGVDEFNFWVDTTRAFSIDLLIEEAENNPCNETLEKAIEWSNLVNKRIKELPPSSVFPNVINTLKTLSSFADLLGVSSANKGAVVEEWTKEGVISYFMDICCQDSGSKSAIINHALSLGYEKNKVIMLGDALGDLNAAHENGVLFYPIIPSKESESWSNLDKEVSTIIKNDQYQGYENKFIDEFNNFLKGGK